MVQKVLFFTKFCHDLVAGNFRVHGILSSRGERYIPEAATVAESDFVHVLNCLMHQTILYAVFKVFLRTIAEGVFPVQLYMVLMVLLLQREICCTEKTK